MKIHSIYRGVLQIKRIISKQHDQNTMPLHFNNFPVHFSWVNIVNLRGLVILLLQNVYLTRIGFCFSAIIKIWCRGIQLQLICWQSGHVISSKFICKKPPKIIGTWKFKKHSCIVSYSCYWFRPNCATYTAAGHLAKKYDKKECATKWSD